MKNIINSEEFKEIFKMPIPTQKSWRREGKLKPGIEWRNINRNSVAYDLKRLMKNKHLVEYARQRGAEV